MKKFFKVSIVKISSVDGSRLIDVHPLMITVNVDQVASSVEGRISLSSGAVFVLEDNLRGRNDEFLAAISGDAEEDNPFGVHGSTEIANVVNSRRWCEFMALFAEGDLKVFGVLGVQVGIEELIRLVDKNTAIKNRIEKKI